MAYARKIIDRAGVSGFVAILVMCVWTVAHGHYPTQKEKEEKSRTVIIVTPMGDGMYSTRLLTLEKDAEETEANADENE